MVVPTAKTKGLLAVPEVSVKERLSSINKKINERNACTPVPEKSASRTKTSETESNDKSKEYITFETRPLCRPVEELSRREYSSSGRSSSSEDYDHVHHPTNHFHHRSLDSLQGHDSPNGFCFERVQSLECIDCCSNYPASVLSGDTDREDSGIHTADVSSSVSQADDFDLHADTSMDVDVKSQNATTLINDDMKVDKSSQSDYCFVSQEAGQGSLDDVHEHVDASVFECENQKDNLDPKIENNASITTKVNLNLSTVEERMVELNQKLDPTVETNELDDKNQNMNEQITEEPTLTSEDICQNDDTVCDNVKSSVDDYWDVDCKTVEQDENANRLIEVSYLIDIVSR